MAKILYYRQCRLSKKIESGEKRTTTWLPEEFAKVNKVIKLKDSDNNWEDGWVVMSASKALVEDKELPDYH